MLSRLTMGALAASSRSPTIRAAVPRRRSERDCYAGGGVPGVLAGADMLWCETAVAMMSSEFLRVLCLSSISMQEMRIDIDSLR